jgi:hypothetical protein
MNENTSHLILKDTAHLACPGLLEDRFEASELGKRERRCNEVERHPPTEDKKAMFAGLETIRVEPMTLHMLSVRSTN